MNRSNKRHILLLEVLVALAIITMCIVPMLRPHLFMLAEEQKFVREVELDRLVGNIYTNLLIDRFYRQGITWDEIATDEQRPVDHADLKRLGYKGTYAFKIKLKKGKMSESDFALDLLTITYTMKPTDGGLSLKYSYDLLVQRVPQVEDLTQKGDEKKDEKKEDKKPGAT